MSFSEVPKEIQAFILSKLDGCSLVRAQRTCKLWYETIHKLERIFHIWLMCCLKEVDTDILVDITGLVKLASLDSKDAVSLLGAMPWHLWRAVYAEFHRARYINLDTQKTIELYFFMGYGMVTCLHMKGDVFVSGHEGGNIVTWKNIDADVEANIIHRHQRIVTDITVLDAGTEDELWAGKMKPVVVSASRDSTLKVNSLEKCLTTEVHCYSSQVNQISSWGNSFVAAADKSMLQGQPVWRVITDSSGLHIQTKFHLTGQKTANMKAVALWGDEIMTGDELGNVFYKKIGVANSRLPANDPIELDFIANLGSIIETIIIKGQKVLCFTGNRNIYTSIDRRTFAKHDMFESLQKLAECVYLWGSILAIGCKMGSVFLYHLQSKEDWQGLDLSKPNHSFHTGSEHINAMAIGDDGAGPVLAIATEDPVIHIVRWRRKK
ncbi:hypothetical protein ScPMuIL_010701 [Solemya velum]